MSKASIICDSCGQDNEFGAIFCIECGASIPASKLGKSNSLEEQIPPSVNSATTIRKFDGQTDKQYHSETKTTSPLVMRCWHMMKMNMNPMFIMMPVMLIIMSFFIFRRLGY